MKRGRKREGKERGRKRESWAEEKRYREGVWYRKLEREKIHIFEEEKTNRKELEELVVEKGGRERERERERRREKK